MKYIYLVMLIIGGLVNGNSQTPEPYFLYLYEWGIGGPSSLNFKVDQITSIDIEKDGYLIKLGTLCIDGILCQRYQKIDFEGNVKWNYDFNDKDTSYLGTPNNQENWIVENNFIHYLKLFCQIMKRNINILFLILVLDKLTSKNHIKILILIWEA